jgi:hypothetical protein
MTVILTLQEAEVERSGLRSAQANCLCKTLSEKQTKSTSAGGMAQVVECLPSKEALSSIPDTDKNKTESLCLFKEGSLDWIITQTRITRMKCIV